MAKVSTLRIRHTFNKAFALDNFLSTDLNEKGFCIEGWVKFAPMDNRARLFLKESYEGAPLRLVPGIYPKLEFEQFPDADEDDSITDKKAIPRIGSIDLPEGVEAVFFSETNFRGKAYPYRDDVPKVSTTKKAVGSVLILDRRHRAQSHVVLFEKEMTNVNRYSGKGQVLQIPQSWTPDFKNAEDLPSDVPDIHQHILDTVGSAWVPPGIALDLLGIQDDITQAATSIAEPTNSMSFTVLNDPESQQAKVKAWHEGAPNFASVDIPEGLVLFLFENDWFEGRYRVLTGKHDEVKKNQWAPNSAVLAAAPDGTKGVLVFKPFPQVYPEGSTLNSWTTDGSEDAPEVWLPTEFALMQSNTEKKVETLNSGFYRRKENIAAKVVQLKKTTLRGDLNNLPAFTKMLKITARRSTPLTGDKMAYTFMDGAMEKQEETETKYWQKNVPKFKSVRVPKDMALFLWSEEKGRGDFQIIVGGKDDFDDLTISEIKSAALVDAPNGVEGVVYLRDGNAHAKKVFKTEEVIQDDGLSYLFIPPGYRLVPNEGEGSLGEIADNPSKSLNVKGYRVEQYVGLFSNNGNGLAVKRSRGMLRAGSDELRFGGKILHTDRWYHLAYNWEPNGTSEKGNVGYFVNGKKARSIKEMAIDQFRERVGADQWVIGNQLRGSLADIRVWKEHKGPIRIKTERYTESAVSPFKKVFSNFSKIISSPNAIKLEAELPDPPGKTRMVKNIMRELEVQRALDIQKAEEKAVQIRTLAEKRMVHRLAQAREKARQLEHLKNMDNIAFVRGKDILVKDAAKSTSDKPLALKILGWVSTNKYALDVNIFRTAAIRFYFIADSWNNSILLCLPDEYHRLKPYCTISADKRPDGYVSRTPQAIVCDHSNAHEEANSRRGIYWIEEDGAIYRYWDDGNQLEVSEKEQVIKLIDALATGRARNWDMALYNDKTNKKLFLIWCNGFEVFQVDVISAKGTNKINRNNIEILVPHAISPHPVAVSADPDGNLVWLDAEEEMVRTLKRGEKIPLDLYPAPNPNRGLSICRITKKSAKDPVTYIYWVSGLRRTVEVPILDTPGRYIDLWQNPNKPVPHGQHVPMVAVDEESGVKWEQCLEVFKLPMVKVGIEVSIGKSFSINMKLKLKDSSSLGSAENLFFYDKYNSIDFWVDLKSLGTSSESKAFTLPVDEWFDLQILYDVDKVDDWSRSAYDYRSGRWGIKEQCLVHYGVTVKVNGKNVAQFANMKTSILTPKQKIRLLDVEGGLEDIGALAELEVVQPDTQKVIAHLSPTMRKGELSFYFKEGRWSRYNWYSYEDALKKTAIEKNVEKKPASGQFQSLIEIVDLNVSTSGKIKFEPIRIDFKKGWTVAADLIWDGTTSNNPVCVYELATFENEDRIVCAIEDDQPVLFIYWNGKQVLGDWQYSGQWQRKERYAAGDLSKGVLHHVCWMYDPKGEVMMYTDGKLSAKAFIAWNKRPVVWEHHSLGAPNPNQLDEHVENASIRDKLTKQTVFESFNGKLIRFGAWNSFEPSAKLNWEQTSDYDPTWDRSLVTYKSRRRYLQAGRLDGSEPPVTLFPLDMDGALNITSTLDSDKAAYNFAQAELAAAEAYAIKLKEDALKRAKDNLALEEKHLEATKARTEKDIADAEDRKARTVTAARHDKSRAIQNFEAKKQLGNKQADKRREDGRKDAESREVNAANDKRNRVADATQSRNEKRNERDRKRNEAKEKGVV